MTHLVSCLWVLEVVVAVGHQQNVFLLFHTFQAFQFLTQLYFGILLLELGLQVRIATKGVIKPQSNEKRCESKIKQN